jgi:hypothetical protein
MNSVGGKRSGFAWALGAAAMGLVALAGAQAPGGSRAQVMVSSGGLTSEGSAGQVQGQLYREIDDPNLGDRWLLVRNNEFPGGPGRLVRVTAGGRAVAGERAEGQAAESAGQPAAAPSLPVIRSGDRVVVEEHTAVVDAVLEGRALRPAAVGAVFEARLAIGGRVVRVVALGPGRAELMPETEARP